MANFITVNTVPNATNINVNNILYIVDPTDTAPDDVKIFYRSVADSRSDNIGSPTNDNVVYEVLEFASKGDRDAAYTLLMGS